MPTLSYLWTRGIYMQRAPQRELLTIQAPVKKRQRGCRTPLMNADDGSPIQSVTSGYYAQSLHRTAGAPPDLSNCPTQSSGRAMELIRKRRSTVVRRIAGVSALGQLYEESERGGSRNVGAVNVGAENVPSGAIHDFLPHARTADERGELRGLFDGNRSGAIDPTAVRQDAAVYDGNESNPAGYGDSGVTKNCGALGDEAGAPLDKGRDDSSYTQPNRLERACCFTTCVDNGESLVRDCGLDSQKFHNGAGRDLNFGLVRGAEDGKSGSPPRLAVREDTRAGRLRHHKVMQDTSRKRKAHESDDCQSRKSFGSLECHGTFHKTGCVAARGSNRGGVQFEPTRDFAVGEARRPVRPSPEYGSIFGEIHHNADPGVVAGRIDVKGDTADGQEPWLRAEERFFHDFNHHAATITRRATRTRLATPQDEHAIPLQQVNVPVLNLEWIMSRLNPATLERLIQVWGLVGRSPLLPSSSGKAREGSRRIPTADAHLLRKAGIIEDASSAITSGWIIPFSVVEEKTTGLRRRWIAWPRDKNRDDPYEAHVPLLHISHYLPPVMAEAASCLDLKASFFQVSLPRETRHLFRCRVEDGTLVELTRLPMGYKASPEILQIITSAIAGVTTVVHRLWAAPPLVRIDVWIDNIRISGSNSDFKLWEAQVLRNADSCHASMGEERESGATHYTFLGVQFDHTHRAVSLSEKFVRSVCAMPAFNSLTIAEMEVMASRFLYTAAILGTRLCDYYFFIKAVRRRLSALNRGIVQETSPANLPPSAVGLGERLRHIIENNRKRIINPTEKASAAIITDASLHGWGAVFLPDSGDVKIAGGKWKRRPFLIMQAEARAVRLALSAFSAILPSTMDVWVDNTSLQGAANKGSSKSHAMTWELQRIYEFLDSRGIQATFGYVRSAENPADGISRGRVFTLQDLANGWNLRRGAAGSCGWRTPKSATS
ncbi:hypothetical protein ECC02_012608 [Trypanosoma cruzi]|uniref:Target of rapamycin (TOR) kinase 1 n=1 Tax=Trypanosoma cruzi TaxID=5693 RepID=A0A7J6XLM6_TRYCR|nr:hypothetical protein ECC02_012608 [Trypanosoma cruzi]